MTSQSCRVRFAFDPHELSEKVGFRAFWCHVGPRLSTLGAAVSVRNAGGPGHPPTWIWLLGLKVTRPFWQEETTGGPGGHAHHSPAVLLDGPGDEQGCLTPRPWGHAVSLVNQRFPYRPYTLGQEGSVCAMCQLGALGLLGTLNKGLLLPPELAQALKVDEMCLFSPPQGSISEPGLGLLSWWTSS